MLLILFKRFLHKPGPAEKRSREAELGPEQMISRIRQGDDELREQLIAKYYPYIAKQTSKFCKRYIEPGIDDEFSIALLAFNEAIDGFDEGAGASFLGFSKTVMQRRLIDHVRKEQRHLQAVPYSSFDSETDDQSEYNILETKQALEAHELEKTDYERRMEIGELSRELSRYEITFAELVEHSPKHSDSRQMLISIAQELAGSVDLMEQVKQKKRLPIKELMEACGVSRKTLERNRKYIISIAVILSGTYPFMNDYLRIDRKVSANVREVSK